MWDKNGFGLRPIVGVFFCLLVLGLSGCSSSPSSRYNSRLPDPIYTMAQLSEQQYQWGGTPYVLGGNTRRGVDCSGFVKRTFADRFGIPLPRTTAAQAKQGVYIERDELQTGDLVFFKTGRGPNGYHVGIYVKNDQFLHASTKGGVIYSSLNSAYWKKAYWQARRI
ncbi:endopeptidase [Chelonobacter oris]|uniref:NlpC/P60 family protein n=1 Tax=Chelonobacter oris TaxID=505317 RepID=UPI00244BED73|nr:NlpC/P60 family protein [Chelonobacter oris]MDH3001599.1 endopeptidase [Chelonobacter oris]